MHNKLFFLVISIFWVACKSPEPRKPITAKSGSFIKESIQRNKALYEKEKQQFERIMQEHPENNYISSQNGFWYFYNKKMETNLATPKFGDTIRFTYNVRLINGDTVYTKAQTQPKQYIMEKQELFTGLREALKLLKAGEEATFFFPSESAYGYYGDANKIGVNVPIICEVNLQSINRN